MGRARATVRSSRKHTTMARIVGENRAGASPRPAVVTGRCRSAGLSVLAVGSGPGLARRPGLALRPGRAHRAAMAGDVLGQGRVGGDMAQGALEADGALE